MKDLVKIAGIIGLLIALKKIAESKKVCLCAGPVCVCGCGLR